MAKTPNTIAAIVRVKPRGPVLGFDHAVFHAGWMGAVPIADLLSVLSWMCPYAGGERIDSNTHAYSKASTGPPDLPDPVPVVPPQTALRRAA